MKRLLIASVAVLGLSGAAFAQMIIAPGYHVRDPIIHQSRGTIHAVSDHDLDDMQTGSIAVQGNGYHNGMYETPMQNLNR